ncbi:MAG: single-stranded DNA-binding protein [Bacilli bacterium]
MNSVNLIGRLVKDPELRFGQGSGTALCRFTLAVNRTFNKDETDFINCIAFGRTAETITQYVTKGRQIGITGEIRTGSYDAQDGTRRYTTDVAVNNFTFVGSSNDGGNNNANNNNYSNGNNNNNLLGGESFEDDITPVSDDEMPFN